MPEPPDAVPVAGGATPATAGLAGLATPRWLERLWTWGPALLPALLTPLLLFSFVNSRSGLDLALLAAASTTTLAVGFRFRYPAPAWAVSLGVVPLTIVPLGAGTSTFVLLALAPTLPLAALATAWPVRRSLTAAIVTGVVLIAVGVSTETFRDVNFVVVIGGLSAVLAAAAWLIGYSLRTRAQYAASLEARARDLERERDARAARAVSDERVRIARDLHDLVSHNVAVMVVQAEAADVVWDADRERAREAVRAVSETGRAAMGELRAMLHAMRVGEDPEGPDDAAERRAQQGLSSLPRVVEQVRAGGQRTELTVDGDLAGLPASIDGSLLRVVQEALTNVLRHAAAETAWVTARVAGDEASVTVDDDGVGIGGAAGGDALDPLRRGGHGLIGIRERVAVMGGTLVVGRSPRGGTRIDVRVPLGDRNDRPTSDRADRQAPAA